MRRLETKDLTLKYQDTCIIRHLDIAFEPGSVTSIIGPNGCGKSTLLKALARQLKPAGGEVLLDHQPLFALSAKNVARQLSYMAQSQEQIDITVKELVGFGRTPHQPYWNHVSDRDREMTDWAMQATGLTAYRDRRLHTLSGGERQRVWIAMALAQQPGVLLLDEPTTYLDIAHQLEVMELVQGLNRQYKMTVIMVLHDINQASVYSDYILAMKSGAVQGYGPPADILTPDLLGKVFGVQATVENDPVHEKPLCRFTGLIRK